MEPVRVGRAKRMGEHKAKGGKGGAHQRGEPRHAATGIFFMAPRTFLSLRHYSRISM
jgi:hypothetical protein